MPVGWVLVSAMTVCGSILIERYLSEYKCVVMVGWENHDQGGLWAEKSSFG
jgi:hypothetical protein